MLRIKERKEKEPKRIYISLDVILIYYILIYKTFPPALLLLFFLQRESRPTQVIQFLMLIERSDIVAYSPSPPLPQ